MWVKRSATFNGSPAYSPGGAITVIGDHMASVTAVQVGDLSLTAIAGLLLTLWSANGAAKAVITGLNVAYDEKETRTWWRQLAISFAFTLGLLVFLVTATAILALQPMIERLSGAAAGRASALIAWPGLFAAFVFGLAILYRYGPSRDRARWRWISWGSVFAGCAWLAASVAFSMYVARFGSYDRTYGPLGVIVGFMTWTWISTMAVLLGAELNSEIEHQTGRDSTVGPERPLGARGAAVPDWTGEAHS